MTRETQIFREKLAALKIAYASGLNEKLTDIKATADQIITNDSHSDSKALLIDLRAQAHKLAGSAGIYGFFDLGNAARNLESKCQSFIEQNSCLSTADSNAFIKLVDSLLHCYDPEPTEQQNVLSPVSREIDWHEEVQANNHTILVVEDDPDLSEHLEIGLGTFGYRVKIINDLDKMKAAIDAIQPSAIILDLEFEVGRTASAETVQRIRLSSGIDCPIIVLTIHGDFNARLAAVRAGCDYFLIKPVTLNEIIQVLEKLTKPINIEPKRILIIDDDPDMLAFISNTLQSSAMIVECLSDPSLAIETISIFHPELILIDMQLSDCTGIEVAMIIRQKIENVGIPIVFLSNEMDQGIQYESISGANEFLVKPIQPGYLISVVQSRIERFRMLEGNDARDSLTGLYNHATTWRLFETVLSRASRIGIQVSFAILDIDGFKSVNNAYGHSVGDNVLKALARVMIHRVRNSDIVGRIGGEEFCIVLIGTNIEQAFLIVETIRLAFIEVSQSIVGSGLPITLSCGIATFPRYLSARDLNEAAIRALNEAKAIGGDKINSASPMQSKLNNVQDLPTNEKNSHLPLAELDQSGEVESVKHAVVLDDDLMVGRFLKPFVENAGFGVQLMTDPIKFLEAYRADVDLIILDLHMPAMDGVEVLRFLGEKRNNAAIIVISIFGHDVLAAAKSLAEKHDLNVIAALHKPLDQGELIGALRMAYAVSKNYGHGSALAEYSEMPSTDELSVAMNNKMLRVYYQPKVKLASSVVVGAEALVRWKHPLKGFIDPEYFVALAEQNGLIDDLTYFVLQEACTSFKRFNIKNRNFKIVINISARNFDDLSFPDKVANIVSAAGISASDVILELTETSLSNEVGRVIEILTRMRLKGFKLSIDDFGTGHSSLTRLHDLPFNELKIDQSFVSRAHCEPAARVIVKNTISLAKSLGLETVAEGAEKQEDIDMLRELGCGFVQGYFIAKPLPLSEFKDWVKHSMKA